MSKTVALRLEIDSLIVGHPTDRECSGAAYPRIVMGLREYPGFSGSGIEQEQPAILIVRGPGRQHRIFAVFGPLKLRQLDIAIACLLGYGTPALLAALLLLFGLCFRVTPFALRLFRVIQLSARAHRRRNFTLTMIDVLNFAGFYIDQ